METAMRSRLVLGIFLIALAVLSTYVAIAEPSGSAISDASTETRANATPDSRADDRSTITTMNLNAIQKDQQWKAYVGNVTGSLTLDDASNYTIYDWDLSTITGEVYASRNSTLDWSSVSCVDGATLAAENIFNNMSASEVDNINQTFNWTIHKAFQVGPTPIGANTCNSTTTYVNSTRTVPSASQEFQEIIIMDANSQIAWLTSIDDNSWGYNNETQGMFDFQMIVPESDVKSSPTTYYFYVELG